MRTRAGAEKRKLESKSGDAGSKRRKSAKGSVASGKGSHPSAAKGKARGKEPGDGVHLTRHRAKELGTRPLEATTEPERLLRQTSRQQSPKQEDKGRDMERKPSQGGGAARGAQVCVAPARVCSPCIAPQPCFQCASRVC